MIELAILLAVIAVAIAVGLLLRRNQGRIKAADTLQPTSSTRTQLLSEAGIDGTAPAVLHFSADWCGPCAAVQRVVAAVTAELGDTARPPRDIEVDIDANPDLARELNVLSLPTTFVFDDNATERFRISGVPKATDLRSALTPLTA
ncbi:thioredoxin family protein [Nocardia camponoti]|uniref:Thiol reductase thioredoxin n=1 Tax=Nocardia camponoti TaxID=1616106 RepID=A0A917QMP0_9NOCA|nr:thioredoxin family protein [Nocardia camponoti]GGK58940.1 thiol reductase thioredoxin [Nocardia camponoti]